VPNVRSGEVLEIREILGTPTDRTRDAARAGVGGYLTLTERVELVTTPSQATR
jgi:hypothetical protein